jgi:hypothetical protein
MRGKTGVKIRMENVVKTLELNVEQIIPEWKNAEMFLNQSF